MAESNKFSNIVEAMFARLNIGDPAKAGPEEIIKALIMIKLHDTAKHAIMLMPSEDLVECLRTLADAIELTATVIDKE